MTPGKLDEPNKLWSGIQASLIMLLLVVPLSFSFDFRKVVVAQPIQVAIVTAPPPEPKPVPTVDVAAVKEQIEATKKNLELAEIARRKQKEKIEQQKKEEEEREKLEAEQRRIEQERIEAEKAQQEEEERLAKLEQEKLLQEKLAKEKQLAAEAEKKRKEEIAKREAAKEAAKRKAEAEEEARRKAEAQAKLIAARNQREMSRIINAIHDRVRRHVTNPDNIPTNIEVEVKFSLNEEGYLQAQPSIIKSSGYATFDNQAVRAVIRGAENGFELPSDPKLRNQFNEVIIRIVPKQ